MSDIFNERVDAAQQELQKRANRLKSIIEEKGKIRPTLPYDIDADIIYKATNVDGVYDSDPKKNPDAKKFDVLSHLDVLQKGLHVMDSTAASLCMDNGIEILVFNLDNPKNIVSAMVGETIGTVVK